MHSDISVVIPTKNRAHLLRETLRSFLNQSLQPKEIIIVDDHSTDGTMNMLAGYAPKVKAVGKDRQSYKDGPGGSRNQGYAISTGRYVKFFDSDDLLTPNSLQDQLETLESSGADICVQPYLPAQYDAGNWVPTDVLLQFNSFPQEGLPELIAKRGFFCCIPTMLIRRDAVEKVMPWPEDLLAYEDFIFFFNLSLKQLKFVHTNRSAMIYRMHGAQTTGGNMDNSRNEGDKLKALEVLAVLAKENNRTDLLPWLYVLFGKEGQKNKWLALENRVRFKIGRLLTGTKWQTFHGPNNDRKLAERILATVSE